MQAIHGHQKGVMVPGVPCVETGDESAKTCVIMFLSNRTLFRVYIASS